MGKALSPIPFRLTNRKDTTIMADNTETTKYLSKIVKGNNTLHIKDAEARAAIAQLDPAEAASVAEGQQAIAELT
jgi:hypothetical protein